MGKFLKKSSNTLSLNALQQYETATEIQLLDVSNVLSNNRKLKTGVVSDTKGDGALQDHVRAAQSNVTTNTSNVMVQKSPEKPIAATVSLRGCNFTNCNIAFSGIFESGSGSVMMLIFLKEYILMSY